MLMMKKEKMETESKEKREFERIDWETSADEEIGFLIAKEVNSFEKKTEWQKNKTHKDNKDT